MAEIISMPKLGFDMAEGTLSKWVKAEGDEVQKGELLAEIETDKATVEVESQYDGIILQQLVSEGAVVPVNTPIVLIGEAGEEFDLQALVGEKVGLEETPAAISTSPVASAPVVVSAVSNPEPVIEITKPGSNGDNLPSGVAASPLARRMASDNQIELSGISGSGPAGRIVKRDIEAYIESPPLEKSTEPTNGAIPLAPLVSENSNYEVVNDQNVPLTRLRKAIGRRMLQSTQNMPQFFVTHQYNLGELMQLRKRANEALAVSDEKLSVNDFIIKAAALTLRQFPNLNAFLDGEQVVQHGQVNVGVAVAVEGGLMTVVCPHADRKSLRQISKEIKAKAGRAREGRVHPDDISGSTFSISNLGMFDVSHFTAIINPPEAAILALGSAMQVPVVEENELAIGWRMNATLTTDHRVSDGAEAAKFMQALAGYLETPLTLML